tara:strand:+ start:199 stop:408 length:210 start_codon:yes stop_codon:yes gene_type:complete
VGTSGGRGGAAGGSPGVGGAEGGSSSSGGIGGGEGGGGDGIVVHGHRRWTSVLSGVLSHENPLPPLFHA